MVLLLLALVAVLSVAGGCTEPRIPPPESPGTSQLSPSDVVPGDLDVIVRVDWAAIRSALPEATTALGSELLSQGRGDELATLYPRADTIWVGFRPGPGFEPLDTVIVIAGQTGDFDPQTRSATGYWLPPRDLGGGLRRWDRANPGKRQEWARIYQRHDSIIAALTVAEVDSMERVLERGASDPRVKAPERGILSAGVRLGPWVETQGGPGFRWLARASSLQAFMELANAEVVAEADIGFESEDQAARGAEAASVLQAALVGKLGRFDPLLRGISVSGVGKHLVVRYRGPLRFERDESRNEAEPLVPLDDGSKGPDGEP